MKTVDYVSMCFIYLAEIYKTVAKTKIVFRVDPLHLRFPDRFTKPYVVCGLILANTQSYANSFSRLRVLLDGPRLIST